MTRCEYILVSSASPSLARKVTVPPVPGNEVYVCKLFRCFKLLRANRVAPISPSVSPTAVGANNVVKQQPITCGALFAQAIL
ncbi:MAG: hypothetical protein SAqTSA_15440 [Shewanella algae]